MKVIVDTNVGVVANQESPQATPACVRRCVMKLHEIKQHHTVVLDNGWLLLREYQRQLRSTGQPGVGDAFLKWLLNNRANPQKCELVPLHFRGMSIDTEQEPQGFDTFPQDPALSAFDPSDRKFVALCLGHPDRPPILNAVDTDWWDYKSTLANHGVEIEFLCPDVMALLRPSPAGEE